MEVFLQANFLTTAAESQKFRGARASNEKRSCQSYMCALAWHRSRMVGKRDLGEGELPALRSSVPDIGEARFLLERLAVVGAAQPDPAAEDDGVAEITGEGRFDDVGVRIGAG